MSELDAAVAEREAGRKLFAGAVEFLLEAPRLDVLPSPDVPEVAVAGRSNVGKSSLLNALTGRSGLARASTTPGRTQALVVFDVGAPPRMRLVDMPGYGFAEAPKDLVRQWQYLIGDYLRGRQVLKRVLLLVDCRHGFKPVDFEIMRVLDKAAVSYQIVLTKADKVKPTELAKTLDAMTLTAAKHPAAFPHLIVTSAETKAGIEELRAAVAKAAFA